MLFLFYSRSSILRVLFQRQSFSKKSTRSEYAGHIGHLFKIATILIAVWVVCFRLSLNFSLLRSVSVRCERVHILFFKHLNMKCHVFDVVVALLHLFHFLHLKTRPGTADRDQAQAHTIS